MLGTLDEGKIALEETASVFHPPHQIGGALALGFCDRLLNELKAGFRKAPGGNCPIASISTDVGVDYVIYDERGLPHVAGVVLPGFTHRAGRGNSEGKNRVAAYFSETGIQFMALDTQNYQIVTEPPRGSPEAKRFCSSATPSTFSVLALPVTRFRWRAPPSSTANPTHKCWSEEIYFGRWDCVKICLPRICPEWHAPGTIERKISPGNRPAPE